MSGVLSRLGITSLLTAAAGPLAANLTAAAPIVGFLVLALGVLLALLTIVLGVVTLARSPAGARGSIVAALLPPLLVVAAVAIGGCRALRYPRINDITTDTVQPPEFVRAATLPANAGRDLAYPGEAFASQQRAGYGEIPPLATALVPGEAFERVRAAASAMKGWVLTREDASARAIEGIDTSRIFRFKDDFVIEVRPQDGGSVVHMRSKSRVGRGDLGANAARIRHFFAMLEPRLASSTQE